MHYVLDQSQYFEAGRVLVFFICRGKGYGEWMTLEAKTSYKEIEERIKKNNGDDIKIKKVSDLGSEANDVTFLIEGAELSRVFKIPSLMTEEVIRIHKEKVANDFSTDIGSVQVVGWYYNNF